MRKYKCLVTAKDMRSREEECNTKNERGSRQR